MDRETILHKRVNVFRCPVCQQSNGKPWQSIKGWILDKCGTCGMVYANPVPTEEALRCAYALPEREYNAFFQSDYIDSKKILSGTAEWQQAMCCRQLNVIEKYIPRRGRILEIGCGSGVFLEEAQKRGWGTFGIDLGNWGRDPAQDKKLHIFNSSLFDCSFEPESFDVVFMAALLEHVQTPQRYADYVYNILKPGGVLYIAGLPNIRSLAIQLGVDKWIGNHPPIHLLYFSRKTIKLLLKKAGFKKIQVKSYGISETVLEAIFNRKKQKYSGFYAGYVDEFSIRGAVIKICRATIYALFNLMGSGSVLEVMGEK